MTDSIAPRADIAVPFPDVQPAGYEWLDDEQPFDSSQHLALTEPDAVITLADLGYEQREIDGTATSIAISSPFRILSSEGVAQMLATARRLREFCQPAGNRIERSVRGGCYRSRWLADLCISPDVTAHLARIYGTSIAPHPMVAQLGHLNFEPSRIDAAVDKWHHDTLPLDYVMMVTDPTATPGGRFEYFHGTKQEAIELRSRGEMPPRERVIAPGIPGPGWAVALHGNMVVHRGGPLTALAERITMVNGFVATDPTLADQARNADLIGVDDDAFLYADWARYAAWRSRGRLDRIIDDFGFSSDADVVATKLEAAVEDVVRAIAEMRAGAQSTAHYE